VSNIVEEKATNFLRKVPPFQFLSEERLRRVAASTEIHFFPKGSVIARRSGPPSPYLYVIEKGAVKKSLTTQAGEEVVVEVAGEGDLVGVLSTLEGDVGRLDDVAIEDTICYAIPRPVVEELLASEPAFTRYFVHFSIRHLLDSSLDTIRRGMSLAEINHQLPLLEKAGDLAHGPIITCPHTASVQQAARIMTSNKVSSVVIVDDEGLAVGIVTDWDLREKVVAAGVDVGQPVATIMSRPLITVSADESVADAVRVMIARNIHHLVVVEDGRPVGMITDHDLIVRQGTSALFIAKSVEHQTDVRGLKEVLGQMQHLLPFLLYRGVRAAQLGRIAAEINDRIMMRLMGILQGELGPPPVPFCWLVLGSEGRREQTIKTDQDNALVYADPEESRADSCRDYFLRLGQRMVSALVEIGFPPCPGRYTADNPQWVLPMSEWKQQFHRWVAIPEPEVVLHSLIFFDFRGVTGDLALAQELRRYITNLMSRSRPFLVHMANLSTSQSPPIGFLGQFIVERSGEHKNQLDLKHRGSSTIVNLVRLFALQHAVEETNTFDRIDALKAMGKIQPELADDLSQALDFILNIRFRHQWQDLREGRPPSNFIDPSTLSSLERSLLKEAFKVVGRVQTVVRQEFHGED
jgi:CBS domain-containing protein